MVFPDLMKTANVADLRNDFRKIAAWISDGESVTVKMRGRNFAMLSPLRDETGPPMPTIDFADQLKRIWGDKVFTDEEMRQMKDAELEGEEG
jgi:antitoxin (DNA-binding transcriptional repressor) of toxin-antitoxin stability system